jgi:penicillin-binding protein 2
MKRYLFSRILLWSFLLVLILQSFRLQIVNGQEQAQRAEQNRFRVKVIKAKRGIFFDRYGRALVENQADFRKYHYPYEMAHVLGYLGEANSDEMMLYGLELGDLVGKAGLEENENGVLKGIDGGVVEEYLASGEKLRSFSKNEAVDGRNLQLSIDKDLQLLVYEKLKENGFTGAIVVGDLEGEILALVSYPSFDSNCFSKAMIEGETEDNCVDRILSDENKSILNRVVSGTYPPASTFKIITSIAALEEIIDESWVVEDKGFIEVGGSRYTNWYYTNYGRTDGEVNVVKAIQRSNDVFYYKLGEELGIEKLAKWGRRLGLGKSTKIKLSGELEGLMPDPNWKKEIWGEDWYLGDTYITAIGQGNLLVTPMQIQMLMTMMANDGYLCQPNLVLGAIDNKLQVANYESQENQSDLNSCKKMKISDKTLELVKEGLEKVCEVGGTAWPFFDFKIKKGEREVDGTNFLEASGSGDLVRIKVAGKTGTAETGDYYEEDGKTLQKMHAWFTAYAPSTDPEIVVTVLLEEGGQGSEKSAQIAKEIFRFWFEEGEQES